MTEAAGQEYSPPLKAAFTLAAQEWFSPAARQDPSSLDKGRKSAFLFRDPSLWSREVPNTRLLQRIVATMLPAEEECQYELLAGQRYSIVLFLSIFVDTLL